MKTKYRIFLSALGAGLIPFCFPPFALWPLCLVSLALLFFAIRGTNPRPAFYLGLFYGFAAYGITLRWFFEIFAVMAPVLFLILGFFVGLFCALIQWLRLLKVSSLARGILAATLWTGIEFYRCELFFLQFPWITPGSSVGPTWVTTMIGVYGMTFLMALAMFAITQMNSRRFGGIMTVCILTFGFLRPPAIQISSESERIMRVKLVQSESGYLPQFIHLSKQEGEADWIIWPEYALAYDVRQLPNELDQLRQLSKEQNALLTLGTQTVVGTGEREWRNTALTLNHEKNLGEYYKARPVHFFNDGIAGTQYVPIPTPFGNVGTPVCFDGDGSEIIRKIAQNGAELFITPIYDSASWTELQHLQHAALFRIRAAETGRWFVCAASSGVTQIIDPHGNTVAQLPMMRDGVLTGNVELLKARTFYTTVGWVFPWVTLIGSVVVVLFGVCRLQWVKQRKKG